MTTTLSSLDCWLCATHTAVTATFPLQPLLRPLPGVCLSLARSLTCQTLVLLLFCPCCVMSFFFSRIVPLHIYDRCDADGQYCNYSIRAKSGPKPQSAKKSSLPPMTAAVGGTRSAPAITSLVRESVSGVRVPFVYLGGAGGAKQSSCVSISSVGVLHTDPTLRFHFERF